MMSTAKDQIKQLFETQPDDNSYAELLRERAFKRIIDKGLADYQSGTNISNEELEHRIKSWQK